MKTPSLAQRGVNATTFCVLIVVQQVIDTVVRGDNIYSTTM